jgi:hypothetical protein
LERGDPERRRPWPDPENQIAAPAFSDQHPPSNVAEDQPMPRIAATVATLALLCHTAAAGAATRTVFTEIVAGDTLTIQTDDATHQGALLLNGQPLIQNANGAVGIDGLFPTPDKLYILADLGETPSCYRYEVVTITGQQSTVSPQFGNCDFASGYLVKDVLHVSLRSTAATATLKASATQTYDGQTLR